MTQNNERFAKELQERMGSEYEFIDLDGGLTIKYNKARLRLAEFDDETSKVTVPLEAEFPSDLDLSGEELEAAARELLRPRIRIFKDRGYELRDMRQQPGQEPQAYDEDKIPVVAVYLERSLDSRDEVPKELEWLVDQLPEL